MAELELCSPRDDLHSQAQPQLWGKQIQGAPQCITLMAKCNLLLSKALMEGIEVSPNGPEHEPLLVLMGRFCRMGESTFRSTATRMKAVGRLTRDMWKPNGTLDSVTKHINMKPCRMRDLRLQSHMKSGLSKIGQSVSEISAVKDDFSEWTTTTNILLDCLRKKTYLMESREALLSPFEGSLETNVPRQASPVVLASIIVSAISESPLGSIVQLGSQWWVQSRIRRLEQQIGILNTVLGDSQWDLDKLQREIAKFMDFLISIQDIVATVQDGDDRVLIKDLTAEDIDDMNDDPQLKKDYLRDVSLMKERLTIASRATELYNELSDKLVLPAIDWVGRLSTLNLSDEAYGEMELEINAKRLELSEGAKQLIMMRVADIGIELKAQDPQANVTELAEDISEEFEESGNI
ncbi:hypothetical protein FPHYL_2649 [Fusarium phyllophilum]|uniref:Uncharacterized protein n=1 Tax=Fusarium phyllophilum TaxID=47803 RepID=A0A8H5KBJ3_9HYPO|nr:hypothetical protein FPHYL_2649 [Fusarium phyllophilum]